MFGLWNNPDEDFAVRRVRLMIGALYALAGLAVLVLAILIYRDGPLAARILITVAVLGSCCSFYIAYMLEKLWAERLVEWWRKPSRAEVKAAEQEAERAWMALFEPSFAKEYPRWKRLAATNTPDAERFMALKDMMRDRWLSLRPKVSRHDDMGVDAMMKVIGFKFDNDYRGGLGMHICYRDWEVAGDMRRLKLA